VTCIMRFTALLIAAACGMIDAATTAAPDLNNGQWSMRDINYYRRQVTKGNTENLMKLMDMNETNETELMLVTPLSEAPTPMPPTPPPTPVPQDVSVSVAFVVVSAASFDMAATLTALGVDTATAKATVVHQIQVTSTISPIPTPEEAKQLYVEIFVGVSENTIKVVITKNAGNTSAAAGGRRLQTSSADVTASGESSNPTVIDAAKATAADPTQITSNLKAISSTKFQYMSDPTIKSAPGITSRLDITQTQTDAASATTFADTIQKKIDSPPKALTDASGATGVS
jgi:hypothetical protein